MALPRRLFIPDGVQEVPTVVPARTFLTGPWAGATAPAEPLAHPGPERGAAAAAGHGPARRRRRALLRGESGLADRPVLLEWFPSEELDARVASEARGLCHVHLLRLHQVGLADARTAFALSEAPLGVDLATIVRASKEPLPAWWSVAVLAAVGRGLLALHRHLEQTGNGRGHGGVGLSTVFVSGSGAVQLLAYVPQRRSLSSQAAAEELLAPELRFSGHLLSPAADVFALAALLRELLPPGARGRGALGRLLGRCLSPHAEQRPALASVQRALEALSLELAPGDGAELAPLQRTAALGEIVAKRCPPAADFAEGEPLEGPTAGLPVLTRTTRTLRALSSPTIASSGSWEVVAEEPAPSLPRPRRRLGPGWTAAAAIGLCAGLGALGTVVTLGALGVARGPRASQAATRDRAAMAPAAGPGVAAIVTAPGPSVALEEGLPLAVGARGASPGLRVQLVRLSRTDDRLRLQLRLGNPTASPRSVELSALRLVSRDPTRQPLPAQPHAPVEIGAGRGQLVEVDFVLPEAGAAPVAATADDPLRLRFPPPGP
jgi:hypothetical protein